MTQIHYTMFAIIVLHQPPHPHIMFFSIDQLKAPEIYSLLSCSVIPRPIAWVSTRSADGVDNLAPYALFTVASMYPPVLTVVQTNPPNRPEKDTLLNLRATGECVVNIAHADLMPQVAASAAELPPDVSEFDACNIKRIASQQVQACGVAQAQVRYECRLRDVIVVTENTLGGRMILLDVLAISVDDAVMRDGVIAADLLHAVGKLGTDYFCDTKQGMQRLASKKD